MPVYFIQNERGDVKIGHSANPEKRLASLRVSNSESLALIRAIEGGTASEKWLHRHFADSRKRGEWFTFRAEMMSVLPPDRPTKIHPLRSYRKRAGVCLVSLAKQCGTSAATISRIEQGKQWPSWELMRQLVDLTGVSAGDFLEFGGSA